MPTERTRSDSVWCCLAHLPGHVGNGIGVPGVTGPGGELCAACAERLGEFVPDEAESKGQGEQ